MQSAKLENFTIATATTVSVDANTTINASATGRGHGGKVVLWSDNQTTFAGTILAKGGAKSGDGGFVETSSHGQLAFTGNVDTRAPHGTAGTLLLDPLDFHQHRRTSQRVRQSSTSMSAAMLEFLHAQIGKRHHRNQRTTETCIRGHSPVTSSSNGRNVTWSNNNSLTLSAYHDIIFAAQVARSRTPAGAILCCVPTTRGRDWDGQIRVVPVIRAGGHVNFSGSTGTVSIFYNPDPWKSGQQISEPNNFSCSAHCARRRRASAQQPSQLTAYMLVNNADDLQAVSTNHQAEHLRARPRHRRGLDRQLRSAGISRRSRLQRPFSTARATRSAT